MPLKYLAVALLFANPVYWDIKLMFYFSLHKNMSKMKVLNLLPMVKNERH